MSGQKSALATGVSSYRMITRHNGKEYKFDIFSHKVENVISKWNEDGSMNPSTQFENTFVGEKVETVIGEDGIAKEVTTKIPFEAYYTPTTAKNGTTIEFEVKSHNKQAFIDAVKSQLLYLKDDITFTVVDAYGHSQNIPFKAHILYEDDNIILCDYGLFNRPHFVIKGIAYGIIDFAEAELSPKFGNMGFKFNMENLDVVPSRESVRYTPKTTAAIVDLYGKIKATCDTMVQAELNETKFFPWLKAASKITNRAGSGNSQDVLTRLSSLVDQSDLNLHFDPETKYSSSFKTMFGPLFNLQVITTTYQNKPKREDSDYVSQINDSVHFQFSPSNSRITAYLMVSHSSISVIRTHPSYRYLSDTMKEFVKGNISKDVYINECNKLIDENEADETKRTLIKGYLEKSAKMMTFMSESKVPLYDEVVVPEDFNVSADIAESEINEKLAEERYKQILKERKANKEFYIQTFVVKSTWTDESKLSRELVKFAELDQLKTNGCQLVYFTEDSEKSVVDFVVNTRISRGSTNALRNDSLFVFKVAKSNIGQVKHIATPIEEWFYNIDDEGVMHLAPLVSGVLNKACAWSCPNNWGRDILTINEGLAEKINGINAIVKDSISGTKSSALVNEIMDLNKLAISYDHDYEVEELSKAIATFNEKYKLPKDVISVDALSSELLTLSEECADFESIYGNFLRHVDIRYVREEIEIILQTKKDQLKFKFKGLHDDFNS